MPKPTTRYCNIDDSDVVHRLQKGGVMKFCDLATVKQRRPMMWTMS